MRGVDSTARGGSAGAVSTSTAPIPPFTPIQRRNFVVLVAHMVLQRMGWIFKLESVVIPAFVGSLTGSPYALAVLPVLNRLGRRLPPLVGGRLTYGRERLKGLLMVLMGLFCLTWAAVAAGLWVTPQPHPAHFLPFFYLAYTLSFLLLGTMQVTRGTMVGRLIPVRRRGAYLGLYSFLGGLSAIPIGLYIRGLVADGEHLQPSRFAPLFTCAAVFFGLATLSLLLVREEPGKRRFVAPSRGGFWRRLLQVLRRDRNFRRLVIATVLLQVHGYVFPFYKRLGEESGALTAGSLGLLVILQSLSLAVSTPVMGHLADRSGHKRVLLVCFAVTFLVPLYALFASSLPAGYARYAYPFLFVLIGFGPNLQGFLANYLLEVSTGADHAVYLSAFGALQLVSMVYAPLVGLVVSRLSVSWAMLGAAVVLGVGLWLVVGVVEPRRRAPAGSPVEVGSSGEF